MKILAFVDVHEQPQFIDEIRKKARNVDALVCAGDMTIFESSFGEMMSFLDSFGKPCLIIHGNHESEEHLETMCRKTSNVRFLHGKKIDLDGVTFIGHGGGGFSTKAHGFNAHEREFAEACRKNPKTVFVTHAPPLDTKLDERSHGHHVGNSTYKEFILKHRPAIVICGHIHETAGRHEQLGRTMMINPGPKGMIITI